MDPQKVADVIIRTRGCSPAYVECINPNVFTRSAGAAVTKLRFATYRPPMFAAPARSRWSRGRPVRHEARQGV